NILFNSLKTAEIKTPATVQTTQSLIKSQVRQTARGDVVASNVTVGGVDGTWDVWTDGECISYVITSPVKSLTFDLNDFIEDAVTTHKGTIDNTMYLTNVYAGFEIWSGGAGLKSTDFYAVVK
ncbi:MAG: hypothetical protein JXR91_00155, partial [Deltaproteobacteria bacterium]|nr:hypothetical protein [Deltaproteobacteria bacterium]